MNMLARIKRIFNRRNRIYVKISTVEKSDDLAEKTIVVTGGGSGIGRAVAESVVRAGGKVILVGRTEQKLQAVCESTGNCNIKYIIQDVNEIGDYHTFFHRCEDCFNTQVTSVVNNAGIYIDKSPLEFTKKMMRTFWNQTS